MTNRTHDDLIEAVRENPDLLERLLFVAEQSTAYRATVTTPEEAYRVFALLIEGYRDERLAIIALDRRRKVLAAEVLTIGNGGATIVCPRQILRWCLKHDASGFVLAHNHPSGDTTPSQRDEDATDRVDRAGRHVGITLLDHLVIGGGSYTSMAVLGMVRPGSLGMPGTA